MNVKSQPMNEGGYAAVTMSENTGLNSEMAGFNGRFHGSLNERDARSGLRTIDAKIV
jgi:hypothetical protein